MGWRRKPTRDGLAMRRTQRHMQAPRLVEYSDSEEDEESQWREFHKQRSTLRVLRAASWTRPSGRNPSEDEEMQAESQASGGADESRDFVFMQRKRTGAAPAYVRRASSSSMSPQVDFSFSFSPMGNTSPMKDESPQFSRNGASTSGSKSTSEEKHGSTPTAPSRPSVFTFGSFSTASEHQKNTAQQVPSTSPFKSFSFSGGVGFDHKTPRRQKDLHRAAKRRVSGGSTTGGLGEIGLSPANPISAPASANPSPFTFGASMNTPTKQATMGQEPQNTPVRATLSPMDIEMDENAAPAVPPAVPEYVFGFQTPTKETKTVKTGQRYLRRPESRINASSSRIAARNSKETFVFEVKGTNSVQHGGGATSTFHFGMTLNSSEPSSAKGTPSRNTSSVFSASEASTVSTPKFSDTPPVAPPNPSSSGGTGGDSYSTSSSFSFDSASQEGDAAFLHSAYPFRGLRPNSGGDTKPSDSSIGRGLAERLERRRRLRERKNCTHNTSDDSDSSIFSVGAQKSLFASSKISVDEKLDRGGLHSSMPEFTFGQGSQASSTTKVTTNAFQKASTQPAPHSRNTEWTFRPFGAFNLRREGFSDSTSTTGTSNLHPFRSPSEPEPSPASPPVDNMKSKFDGFNIGLSQKPSRTKNMKIKQRHANINKGSATSRSHSPFDDAQANTRKRDERNPAFIRTPPADPFVMPLFGQKRSNGDEEPKAKQRLGARFSAAAGDQSSSSSGGESQGKCKSPHGVPLYKAASASPFGAPSSPFDKKFSAAGQTFSFGAPPPVPPVPPFATRSTAQQASAFGESNPSPFAASSFGTSSASPFGAPSSSASNSTPLEGTPPIPKAAFFPNRRVLKAVRPTQQTRSRPTDDDSHHGWVEWKALGGSAYTKRDYQEAADCYLNSIIALEALLSSHPEEKTDQVMKDKAKLHSNRAAALMMLMQMADAHRECNMSIESDPAYTRAYLRLGRIQVMLGDTDGATQSVTTAKQLLAMGEGGCSRDNNDENSVVKIESAVRTLERLQSEIKWSLDVRDYSNALTHLLEALAVAPNCRAFQNQKAQVLFDQKNYAQVVEYCAAIVRKQKVVQRSSRSSKSTGTTKPDSREENEVAILGLELSLLRIRALHRLNKVEDAIQHMQGLEVAAPSSEKVIQIKRQLHDMKELKHEANDLFKKSEFKKAHKIYSQALLVDPNDDEYCAVIFCNRAAALMGMQQYESALHDCNAALRRKARYPRCLLRRARCNVALKRYAAAITDFDRYLKDHPSDSTSGGIEQEKKHAQQALDNETQQRKQKEEEQRRDRQQNFGRGRHQQQGRRNNQHNRHAWDDSKFYEEFWRSSSNGTGRQGQKSSGTRGANAPGAKNNSKHGRTHYEVLGIQKSATQDEIKKAYRKLALRHHPDKAKDTVHADLFKDMTAAYNVLSDPAARTKYDREIQYSGYGRYYEF